MCAIFGWVGADDGCDAGVVASVRRMRDALAHRGPDGWGVVTLAGHAIDIEHDAGEPTRRSRLSPAAHAAVLGHHRLAIIDLTPGGRQPRSTPDGRFWITYNGEIYNYRELRRDLQEAGVAFESQADTEVVLALFVREGPRALDRLRGMFALAVWDDLEGALFLARDRFGMKPLVWTEPRAGTLLFASEPKACLASGLVSPDVDPPTEARFLRRGYLPTTTSAYRSLQPLAPGRWLRWTRDGIVTGRYWSLDAALGNGPARRARVEEAAQTLDAALTDSVRAHLVSDVPVGLFLSGGVDSTAVLAAARRVSSGTLRTFTVGCPGMPWDESASARATAARFDTTHTDIVVTADEVFAGVDRFFDTMDDPTADGLNTFVVARAAREAGLKVVVSGLGGDELLGGYGSFVGVPRLARVLALGRRAPALPRAAAAVATRLASGGARKIAEILRDAPCDVEGVWRRYRALFTRDQVLALARSGFDVDPLEEAVGSCLTDGRETAGAARSCLGPSGPGDDETFWRIVRCEVAEFMIPQLLRDADQFTMTWGLELRTPFVDHAFFAAMRRVGAWPRRRGLSFKATLFAATPQLVPPAQANRPKRGFVLPMDRWLRDALSGERPRDEGFAALRSEPRYRVVVDDFLRGRLHWSRPWALYVLERWRQGRGFATARENARRSP